MGRLPAQDYGQIVQVIYVASGGMSDRYAKCHFVHERAMRALQYGLYCFSSIKFDPSSVLIARLIRPRSSFSR
jgi:hypothetical protein